MTDLILRIITSGGYVGIAFLMALENVIPPVPSEVIMGFGGIAVSHGHMNFTALIVAGTIGSTLGNYGWYLVGAKFGYARLKPFVDRWGRWLTIDWHDVEAINAFFQRHGGKIVFFVRFFPTFRTMVSLPAGMTRMPQGRFLVFTAGGAAIWNTILAGAGYVLGTRFGELERYVGPVGVATVALVAIWYLWRVFTWKPRAER